MSKQFTSRQFAIPPPDARLVWLLPVISTVAAVGAIAVLASTRDARIWLVLPAAFASLAIFALRINAAVLAAAQRWADDELRSLNAQIEYLLRDALRKTGRLKAPVDTAPENDDGQ